MVIQVHDWWDWNYFDDSLSVGDKGYIITGDDFTEIKECLIYDKFQNIPDCYFAELTDYGPLEVIALVVGRFTPTSNTVRMYKSYKKAKEALDSRYLCLMLGGVPAGVTVEEFKTMEKYKGYTIIRNMTMSV